jgi:hypothetical protein
MVKTSCGVCIVTLVLAGTPAIAQNLIAQSDCHVLPRTEMVVRLTVNSPLITDQGAAIRQVVSEIWAGEGILIRWVANSVKPTWAGLDAWIVAGHQSVHASKPTALGAVQFGADGLPGRLLRLSVDAVETWVMTWGAAQHGVEHARHFRRTLAPEALLSRALGFAAAHELGHFMLASKSHASAGLMQASYWRPNELTLRYATLDADSRERLQVRLAAGSRCRVAADLVARGRHSTVDLAVRGQ